MNDGAAMMVLFFIFTTLCSIGLCLREVSRRKRLENRLWGIAAAQGMTGADLLSGDMPLPIQSKKRSDDTVRMEQLESQVDMIAQQLDRLVESQEFLSRVIADRADRLPDPRLRTPH